MGNKKLLALVASAALVAALGLAGCGSSQASSASSSASAESSAAAAASSSAAATEASSASAAAAEASSPAAAATAQDSNNYIGEDAAKEIALTDAGVAEADCTELNVHLDTDDAVVHYDVEFKAGGSEYDYDIDPATGNILKSDSEIDD
ncbi:MAG: PepSY domain-containing protein [Eggerthellaceae bacterium]|nr:PepSY domain-containing protein [Eggerthellaceae bacterium]